jgi:hypothetical protein
VDQEPGPDVEADVLVRVGRDDEVVGLQLVQRHASEHRERRAEKCGSTIPPAPHAPVVSPEQSKQAGRSPA